MLQLIEIHRNKFCIKINGVDCVFMPMELFLGNSIIPLNKVVKGSTLGWYVGRKFVSYNKIKKGIK